MADKHPYVSAPGGLAKTIGHYRKSLPSTIDSNTLRRLGFAPNNESYVINVLRFLGLVNEDNKKTEVAAAVFSKHDDPEFSEAFEEGEAILFGAL